MIKCREVKHAEKSEAQIPTPDKRETKMLINCRMWSTSPQTHTLLKVSPQLYIFEDNEAVLKMIMKGRSPTMRHVSRTHRVARDWLLDRINVDPKIQITYVDTKNQLADMSTKGNFTRDEWDHLLRLLNIMNFLMCSCKHFPSNRIQSVSCSREPRKIPRQRGRQWRNRDQ